jgi:hypothetical protein
MKSDELQRHYSGRRYSDGDQVQPILMLSISVPLDLGVCNKLSIELLKFALRKQRSCGEVLVTVPCDYSALSLCICILYQDHLGKYPGVQHLYIPYITYARSASYCLIQLWSLVIWSLTITWDPGKLQRIKGQALWPKNCFRYGKNVSNFQMVSCWDLHTWMLSNQFSEMKCPYQTVLQQLLAYESTSSFTESWIQTPSEKW